MLPIARCPGNYLLEDKLSAVRREGTWLQSVGAVKPLVFSVSNSLSQTLMWYKCLVSWNRRKEPQTLFSVVITLSLVMNNCIVKVNGLFMLLPIWQEFCVFWASVFFLLCLVLTGKYTGKFLEWNSLVAILSSLQLWGCK